MPLLHGHVAALVENGFRREGSPAHYADEIDRSWISFNWPEVTYQTAIGGRNVNYVDTGGDGKVLLLIHGLGGCWQNWVLNVPVFCDRYRVVVPDLPGFGESEMPEKTISIVEYAEFVDRFLDLLNIEDAIIVGNSMGGFIAAEFALLFPERVNRLVLLAPAGLSSEYDHHKSWLAAARIWVLISSWFLARREMTIKRPLLRRTAMQMSIRYPERLSFGLAWELFGGLGKPGFLPALRAIFDFAFRDELHKIECPTLLMWGHNDMMVPVTDAKHFETLIGENATTVIFEDTGHLVMLERPDGFNLLLSEFLS